MIRTLFALTVCLSLPLIGVAQDQEKLPFNILDGKSGFSGDALGSDSGKSSKVNVTAEMVPVDTATVDVRVHVTLPAHHYTYSDSTPFGIPSKIAITAPGFELDGPMRSDRPPKVVTDSGFTMEKFYDKVTWTQRLRSTSGPLKAGLTMTGEFTGQYCSDRNCFEIRPPLKFKASLPADFVPPAAAVATPSAANTNSAASTQVVVPKMRLPRGVTEPPIRFTVSLTPADAGIGDHVTLSVKADIDEPYHTYSITQNPEIDGGTPTEIEIEQVSGAAATWNEFRTSQKPETKPGAKAGDVLELHHGSVEWTQEYVVSDESVVIGGTIFFQICDESTCQPPAKAPFLVQLGGSGQAIAALPPGSPAASDGETADTFGGDKKEAMIPFILSAIGAGFLALLTPCVFPMIPVTVSYFLKQGEKNPGSTLKLAVMYCLSIVGAFTVLGLLVGILLGPEVLNQLANNPWLNLIFAVVFTVFSLMLLGMFEFQMPSWLLTWTSKKQETGGVFGVVFMALTFTLVSFTCTFAFVGNVLVLAASGEDYLRPVIGMAAFSTAFASPFFLLALFPAFLKRLPKSGGWMNRVKVTLGLLELAVVTKFLSVADIGFSPNGLPQYLDYHLVMGSWIAVAIITSLYLLNVFRMPHDTPSDSVGPLSCLFSLGFMGLSAYIAVGLFSPKAPEGALWQQIVAFAPPQLNVSRSGEEFVAHHDGLSYSLDFDAAVRTASRSNKPMFLDFTGVTCINCRLMENSVLSSEPVHQVIEDLVRVQLFVDEVPGAKTIPEEHERLLKRNHELQNEWLEGTGIPAYVIATPDGKEILSRFSGLDRSPSGKDFQTFLDVGLQKWEARKLAAQSKPDSTAAISASFHPLQ